MSNRNHWVGPGALLCAALLIGLALILPNNQLQAVEGQSRNQPMVCNGLNHSIAFPNFVTAYVWLEQVRWKKVGSSSVTMKFDAGKNVALSYQCSLK